MPTYTPFLGMSDFNSTTDGSATFATFRAAIAGVSPTANFNLLDTFAQNISASIISLQGRAIYLVPAVYVSPNYYEANSLTSITAYTTGMYIDIYLDTTNVGSVTLNINALGTKTLKKIDATGALVDLDSNDLEKNKEYLFRYNGTYFVWVAVSSGTGGTTYSGSALITVSGSKISHTVSGVTPGTYTSLNATIDDYGHITAASNGASASSTGAPSDTPFIVSGSVSAGVTNAKQLIAGSYMSLTPSGSTLIIAGTCDPLTEITGSSIMSNTTGSIVKHNYSGVIAGSANKVQYDSFGHIISASIIPVPVDAVLVAGQALQTFDATTGSWTRVPLAQTINSTSGCALASYNASTGLFTSASFLTSVVTAQTISQTSGCSLVAYNAASGSFTSASFLTGVANATESSVGLVQIASVNIVELGASGSSVVSASSLAHSNYGIRTVEIALNGSTALTTSDKGYFRVPSYMNGWNLINMNASCSASSTSGSPSFNIKCGSQVMLSASLVINQGYTDSSISGSGVISSIYNTIYSGSRVEVSTTSAGTDVLYVIVSMDFRLP